MSAQDSPLAGEMAALGQRARTAARALARSTGATRIAALIGMADGVLAAQDAILVANAKDLANADARGVTGALRDRLALNPARIQGMAQALRDIAAQPDPVGEVTREWVRPNGLRVAKMRIPLGVIGIVYEARPNVTSDAAGLCLKSGNVVILRGGSEAQHANAAILEVLRTAVSAAGLPADALLTLPSTDRAWILEMLHAEDYLDVVIPRGGEALIRFVTANARVPVIKHYKGVCHVFIDRLADHAKGVDICMNAKVQRPGVCNAMETLLVHAEAAAEFLPRVAKALTDAGVELRGCARTRAHIEAKPATDEDYHEEFLDLILAIKVVDDLDGALDHIASFGSDHTEAIVSEDYSAVRRFLDEVQSSVVMANASTRFSDGGQLGLGAEIGISTSKIHAYGPMGAEDLTTTKFVIRGTGQVRG